MEVHALLHNVDLGGELCTNITWKNTENKWTCKPGKLEILNVPQVKLENPEQQTRCEHEFESFKKMKGQLLGPTRMICREREIVFNTFQSDFGYLEIRNIVQLKVGKPTLPTTPSLFFRPHSVSLGAIAWNNFRDILPIIPSGIMQTGNYAGTCWNHSIALQAKQLFALGHLGFGSLEGAA